ncbi:MAG: pyrroline-5-carboxylate reductase [Candidatus Omnitrophota bacterium]
MRLGIIGCGNMGEAILRGILAKKLVAPKTIICSDKNKEKLKQLSTRYAVTTTESNSKLAENCDVLLIAVKPQDIDTVLQDIKLSNPPSLLKNKLIISICAGIKTAQLEKSLDKVSVIRAMPNMGAQISQAISALSPGKYAAEENKKTARDIFSCIGEVVELKEELLDAVTAVSGSGPAYFFYLAENLIRAAEELGIPLPIARKLAVQTAIGSAGLMEHSGKDPQTLRKEVTSPGGTTEAAFNVFNKYKLDKILDSGVKAAAARAKQLSRGGV